MREKKFRERKLFFCVCGVSVVVAVKGAAVHMIPLCHGKTCVI